MAGGAVAATVADSSATWYNPAGLGAVALDQIEVSGTVYTLRSYRAPGFLRSTTGASDDGSIIEFMSVPSQVGYVRRLAEGVSLGLGYFVPSASNLVLRESLLVQSGGADVNWQLALSDVQVQHNAGAALGLQLSDEVRFGFSLIGTYEAETQSVSLVALAGQPAGESPSDFLASTLLGTAYYVGLEVGAGFQFELGPNLKLGINLRSARLLLYQSFHVLGASGLARVAGGEASIRATAEEPIEVSSGVHPIRAGRAGIALARTSPSGDWVSAELDLQPGIYNESAGVDRRAVVNARLGAYHRLTEKLAIGAGVFTDRSPDPPPRDILSGYGNFYGATIGLEHHNLHRLTGERSDRLSFTSTFALRYAFSNGQINDVLVDPDSVENLSVERGRLLVHELGFYVGGGLSF